MKLLPYTPFKHPKQRKKQAPLNTFLFNPIQTDVIVVCSILSNMHFACTIHITFDCRYSLSGGIKPIPPPLISVDTSHSISSSGASDYGGNGNMSNGGGGNGLPAVYGVPPPSAAVHQPHRPSSRYSNRSHRSRRQQHGLSGLGGSQHIHSSSSAASMPFSKYSNGRMVP